MVRMAAIAAIRIDTEDTKAVSQAEWDGKDWTFKNLSKPSEMSKMLWEVKQMKATLEFRHSQVTIQDKLMTERAPYNMRYMHWVAKSIMEHHVERGLGKITQPMSKDHLLRLT